jgi:DNA-binding transcriptional MerR regulator
MGSHHPIRKTVAPESPQIPDKLYFRIGDVARLCAVPAYVLRFWESEFSQLKPNKGGTGQRLYRRKDVEMALRIKSLLYEQGYTIAGARQIFKAEGPRSETAQVGPDAEQTPTLAIAAVASPMTPESDFGEQIRQRSQQHDRLRELRAEILSVLDLLGGPVSGAARASEDSGKTPRPRLMVEPKPSPRSESRLRLEKREERPVDQRALFLFDVAEPAETPSPHEIAE